MASQPAASAEQGSLNERLLPDDLLGLVFAQHELPEWRVRGADPSQQLALPLVCRRWERVTYSQSSFWRTVSLSSKHGEARESELARADRLLRLLRRVAPLVTRFELRGFEQEAPQLLGALDASTTTTLKLQSTWQLTEPVAAALPRFSQLSSLSIDTRSDWDYDEAPPPSMHSALRQLAPTLRCLVLWTLRFYDCEAEALRSLTGLTELELSSRQPMPATVFQVPAALPQLERLTVGHVQLTGEGDDWLPLTAASSFSHLTYLAIRACRMQLPDGTCCTFGQTMPGRFSPNFANQFGWHFVPHHIVWDAAASRLLIQAADLPAAGTLASLLHALLPAQLPVGGWALELGDCLLSPDSFERCGAELAAVTRLTVSACTVETDDSCVLRDTLGALLALTPALRKLHLRWQGKDSCGDLLVAELQLEIDDLSRGLTAGLPSEVNTLKHLEELLVQHCDLHGELLEGPYLTGLTSLALEGTQLTSLPASLTAATRLQVLSMAGSQALQVGPELLHTVEQLPALREVTFGQAAPDPPAPGITALAQQRPELQIAWADRLRMPPAL